MLQLSELLDKEESCVNASSFIILFPFEDMLEPLVQNVWVSV